MSCRVIGRNVEFSFMKDVLRETKDRWSVDSVYAEFISTPKNVLAKDFFSNCGFLTSDNSSFSGVIDTIIENLDNKIKKI